MYGQMAAQGRRFSANKPGPCGCQSGAHTHGDACRAVLTVRGLPQQMLTVQGAGGACHRMVKQTWLSRAVLKYKGGACHRAVKQTRLSRAVHAVRCSHCGGFCNRCLQQRLSTRNGGKVCSNAARLSLPAHGRSLFCHRPWRARQTHCAAQVSFHPQAWRRNPCGYLYTRVRQRRKFAPGLNCPSAWKMC